MSSQPFTIGQEVTPIPGANRKDPIGPPEIIRQGEIYTVTWLKEYVDNRWFIACEGWPIEAMAPAILYQAVELASEKAMCELMDSIKERA